MALLLVLVAGGAGFDGEAAGVVAAAGGGGVAGFDPDAGVDADDVPGFAAGVGAGLALLGGTPYHVFNPLCPVQAPILTVPLK